MPLMAACPRKISSATPAAPTISATHHDGDVLEQHAEREQHDAERGQGVQPVNGGARNAPADPQTASMPKTMLLSR